MKRKTYNNVLKAGKLIQKKGYEKQESLEIAVKLFDDLEKMNNGMPVEWLIEKLDFKRGEFSVLFDNGSSYFPVASGLTEMQAIELVQKQDRMDLYKIIRQG